MGVGGCCEVGVTDGVGWDCPLRLRDNLLLPGPLMFGRPDESTVGGSGGMSGAHWAVAQMNPENQTLLLKKITHGLGQSGSGEDYVFVGEDEFFVKNRSCKDDFFGEDYVFHEL